MSRTSVLNGDDPGDVAINCSIAPTVPRRKAPGPVHRGAMSSDDSCDDDSSEERQDIDEDMSDGQRMSHTPLMHAPLAQRLAGRRRSRSLEAPLKMAAVDDTAMEVCGLDGMAPIGVGAGCSGGNRSLPQSPVSRKRKAASQTVELDDLETLSLGGDSDVPSVWVHHAIGGENARVRDVLLVVFSAFGDITDFYNPIGLPYAYVCYKTPLSAALAVAVFADRTEENVQRLLASIPPDCAPVVLAELPNIDSVVRTSERALLRGKRKRMRQDGPSQSSGFVTVKELSHLENMGRDISSFAVVSPS